jgi:hypothetical protein
VDGARNDTLGGGPGSNFMNPLTARKSQSSPNWVTTVSPVLG